MSPTTRTRRSATRRSPTTPRAAAGGGVYRDADEIDPGVFADGDSLALEQHDRRRQHREQRRRPRAEPELESDDGEFLLGFSLVGGIGNATITEEPAGSNLIGVDPQLGPLADNGGPTQTQLPAATTPAIDAGIANGLSADQRGLARTFDASNATNAVGGDATDIGAVEQAAEGVCKGLAATVLFAPGQPITGSSGPDVIVGTTGQGQGQLRRRQGRGLRRRGQGQGPAKGGKDTVKGGPGKDKLKGGAGKDKLSGQGGRRHAQGPGR